MASEDVSANLDEWVTDLPHWQQEALNRLVKKSSLDDRDISELVDLCIKEAGGIDHSYASPRKGSLLPPPENARCSILKISDAVGVNAIKQNRPLEFAESGLTVIYGRNGSGKSGYSRMLKKAAGYSNTEVLSNIYVKNAPDPQCTVTAVIDDKEYDFHCKFNTSFNGIEELGHIDVFDAESESMYFEKGKEPSYIPSVLLTLLALVDACDKTKRSIETMEGKDASATSFVIPEEAKGHGLCEQLTDLTWETSKEQFNIEWTEEQEKRLAITRDFLSNKSPEAQLSLVRAKMKATESLSNAMEGLKEVFSKEKAAEINDALAESAVAEAAASSFVIVASDEEVTIGSAEWRLMWEAANKFRTAAGQDLENRCPLCLRKVDEEAQASFELMNAFVQSDLSEQSRQKSNIVLELLRSVPSQDLINRQLLVESVLEEYSELVTAVKKVRTLCIAEAKHALACDLNYRYLAVDMSTSMNLVESLRQELEKQMHELELACDQARIDQARIDLKELSGMKFIAEKREMIVAEIDRLARLHEYAQAKQLTRTNRISQKVNQISSSMIEGSFIAAFDKEIRAFSSGKIAAVLKKRNARKGRIPYAIGLSSHEGEDVSPVSVLSDGEKRIAALAAFLADTCRVDSKYPLVFDDPITSLDDDYEDVILQRLLDLSKERQVIVFTHRVSTAVTLMEISAKRGIPVCKREIAAWPGSRDTGLCAEHSFGAKPQTILNELANGGLTTLRNAEENGNLELCKKESQYACQQIRIAVEACVEQVLFDSTVLRFRREIQTKGKIGKIACIQDEDCRLIDTFMTRYSFNEHSAPLDHDLPLRTYQQLSSDVATLLEWTKEFAKRRRAYKDACND